LGVLVIKRFANIFLVGILCGQLLSSGCASTATIKKPEFAAFAAGQSVSAEQLQNIKSKTPKDAVFADLLQAFALMRTANIENKATQKEIINLLTESVSTFEDMTDPVNFSKAFSADEDKAFRGRPHERMYTSIMAAVFLMGQGNYDLALSYLRNAEFLDARFQKLPFGTDAPLAYALMYWCLQQRPSDSQELKRAADGVYRSVRFLTLQETLIKALVAIAQADLRPMAISNRLAYMIFEISIYHSLISAPNNANLAELIDDIAKNAELFTSVLTTNFEQEYKDTINPALHELSKVYGLNSADGRKHLQDLAFSQIGHEAKQIGAHFKQVFKQHAALHQEIINAMRTTELQTDEILAQARRPKLLLNFSGMGPTLERKGSYDEISVIRPSAEASLSPAIRQKNIMSHTACGFHRTHDGGFSAVLCSAKNASSLGDAIERVPSLELLSLSRKASTVGGRKFDEVLKGRARFRAVTEDIATVGAWSAFFLFHMGNQIIADCNRRGQGDACYTPAYALWAIAGVTVLFSGTAWLIGRASNPAADSRFIHLMYESTWYAI
jgi:uncharacterized protein YdcH (DUF465 family)